MGVRWVVVARAAGLPVSWSLGQKLTVVSHFFSTVLPGNGAGDLAKALILSRFELKEKGGTSSLRNPDGSVTEIVRRDGPAVRMGMIQIVGTMIPDRLSGMTGLFAGWTLCLGLEMSRHPALRTLLLPFLLGAGAGTLALCALLFLLPHLSGHFEDRLGALRFAPLLKPLIEGLRTLRESATSTGTLIRALVLSLFAQVLFFGASTACARALGLDTSWVSLGAIMPMVALFNAIPLTPGGVGIGEGVAASALHALGQTPQAGAEIMFLLRMVLWGVAFVGFVVWLTLRRETPKETP
jgi:hypothetical protein